MEIYVNIQIQIFHRHDYLIQFNLTVDYRVELIINSFQNSVIQEGIHDFVVFMVAGDKFD